MKSHIAVLIVLGAILVLLLSSCAAEKTVAFESLDALKEKLGPSLLYLDNFPEGFTPDDEKFRGLYYNDSDTWEYHVGYQVSDIDDEKKRTELAANEIKLLSIAIRAYEPLHKSPKQDRESSERNIQAFNLALVDLEEDYHMYIGETEVIYIPHAGEIECGQMYSFLYSTTRFMPRDVLYEIQMYLYAGGKTDPGLLETAAKTTAAEVVASMLGVEPTDEEPPSSQSPFTVDEGYEAQRYCGVLQEGEFFHDGRKEWLSYYYSDIGEANYALLYEEVNCLDGGTDRETMAEIQLYTANQEIDLKDYVGKQITFTGFCFKAETVYHQRNIVFEVNEIAEGDWTD